MNQKIQVIYDCSNFLLINKPPGLLSQTADYRTRNLETVLELLDNPSYKIVHRLDTNVTGGMVIAKNKNCAKQFHKNLSSDNPMSNLGFVLRRRYVALVEAPITTSGRGIFQNVIEGKVCQTKYKIADLSFNPFIKEYALSMNIGIIILELMTGRKHQIRIQLQENVKTACVNDLRYGSNIEFRNTRQIGLHSAWVNTRVGMDNREFLIPIVYGQHTIWKNFADEKGNLLEGIQNQLRHF